MKAYKIWEDTPHFIHKDSTNDLNVRWTEDIEEAKEVFTFREAVDFFFNHLGFSLNLSKPNALYLTDETTA